MSSAYDDSRYLARTLAATMLDLEPAQRKDILAFLRQELERLTLPSDQGDPDLLAESETDADCPQADNDVDDQDASGRLQA